MVSSTHSSLAIGCGAGFAGDRWDAAGPVVASLIQRGGPAALIYENLAERTLALAQQRRKANPEAGWEPSLPEFLRPVMADCLAAGIPIVGNFGAANPRGAAARILALARELQVRTPRVAVIEGDDLLATLSAEQRQMLQFERAGADNWLSANVYLGAEEIAAALAANADIVVTGRVADAALTLGPLMHHFGWSTDNWDLLAAGTVAGHLLECGAQLTGGYFADPGLNDVPDLARVGFPIVEVNAQGEILVCKPANTGGRVDRQVVIQQLLYEIHDPSCYLTPDVVVDMSAVEVSSVAPDQVRVSGVRGRRRPEKLKATVCHENGWLAEAEVSYPGINAHARAQLAAQVVQARIEMLGLACEPLRIDFLGQGSTMLSDKDANGISARPIDTPFAQGIWQEVRLRVAGECPSSEAAQRVAREVLSLYTCGPAAGGGVRSQVTPRIATHSVLVPRSWVSPSWEMVSA